MHVEEFRQYCLQKPGVEEGFPFDETTLVFKVMGKIFTITGLDAIPFRINLKCDPDRAIQLREDHPQIIPGWHMNKQHWNTVYCEDGLDDRLILELIDHSYDLIAQSLPKAKRLELEQLTHYRND